MGTVAGASVMPGEQRVQELPEQVREALGELAGAAKEGLLALSVGVGLGVLHELMEAEVDEVVARRAVTIPTARWCATAMRAGKSRLVAGACRSAARAFAAPTAQARLSWAATGTSPRAISLRPWCWSGCWSVSRRAATRAPASRSAARSTSWGARHRSRRFRAN